MNSKFATGLAISALILPVGSYAAENTTRDRPSVVDKVKENVGDASITTRIKTAMARDKLVSATNINVDTDAQGMVTLTGNAKNKAEFDRAERIAKETTGVRSVRNNIVVAGGKTVSESVRENVKDASITTRIKTAFARDNVVSATNIKVDTEDKGVVTLSGNAKDKAEFDRAARIAKETTGVTMVRNNIVIAGGKTVAESVKENVGDAVITGKIKAEFAKDKQVSALNVTVNTDDKGVVTLSGNAKSMAEVDQAVKIARNTKGVSSVRNDIKIMAK
jgi:hyperosmotically inducible protein